MIKRIAPLLVLAALALPAAAAATRMEVRGPLRVTAAGFLRGELQSPAGSDPVRFQIGGGAIGLVDLGGDLKVACGRRGETKVGRDRDGHTVTSCTGKWLQVRAAGTHFRFRSFGPTTLVGIPGGVTGTLEGQFRSCGADLRQGPARPYACEAAGGGAGITEADLAQFGG